MGTGGFLTGCEKGREGALWNYTGCEEEAEGVSCIAYPVFFFFSTMTSCFKCAFQLTIPAVIFYAGVVTAQRKDMPKVR